MSMCKLIHTHTHTHTHQAIAILWKQKISSKHHINTTTQEHQILHEKPFNVEGKTMQ